MKEDLKSIRISKNTHKKLKIFCSENDLKIGLLLDQLVLDHIEKNKLKDVIN